MQVHGFQALGSDPGGGLEFWRRRWEAEIKVSGRLPAYEDVAIGSIGGPAEKLALLHWTEGDWRLVQTSPGFDAWLYHGEESSTRPDGLRIMTGMSRAAIRSRTPVSRRATGIHGGRIETSDALALPLHSRWMSDLVLFYVGPVLTRHDVTETVYRSTREGFLLLTPVRDENGTATDYQVVSANPGAGALLRRDETGLLWARCSSLLRESDRDIAFAAFEDALLRRATRHVDLNLSSDERETYLRGSVAALDDLLVLTLTDVTELTTREAGFRLMFEPNPVPMALVDTETMRFIDVNTSAAQHYGYARANLIGMPHSAILHPTEHAALAAVEAEPASSYDGARVWQHLRADGRELAVRPYGRRLLLRRRPAALVAFFDVTASQTAEKELQNTKAFLDTIIENIPSALLVEDAEDNRLLLINRTGEAMLGMTRETLLGRASAPSFLAASEPSESSSEPDEAHPDPTREITLTGPQGDDRILSVTQLTVPDEAGASRYKLTIADDVTERRAFEARIAHMAHHDALTDLPNRALFAEQLEAALARMHRLGSTAAVLGIDLDGFKAVNDTLGHGAGDELLKLVAARLRRCLRPGDLAARLGGDEFAILLDAPASSATAGALASRLVTDLSEPFHIAGHEGRVGASVGIALAPDDGRHSEPLLHNADLALYRAKKEGKGTYRFFEPEMNTRLQLRHELERDLRKAVASGELELHYQPLFDLNGTRVCSCEALLRWKHPTRGYVSPAQFIPIAEETGLIGPIGTWVLREACREAATRPTHIKVAVNVSAAQFRDPHLVGLVVSALAAGGLAPERLEIEITESVLLTNTETHLAVLHKLRDLGVKIAMDDFGTGYSSLSYLSTFPFDKIKIDQSFVRDLETNPHCGAIIKAITELGNHLGITTVAEGVETNAQMINLRQQNCRQAQGFLLGRPQPAASVRRHFMQPTRQGCAA